MARGGVPQSRVPVEALRRVAGAANWFELALMLGVHHRQVHRWRAKGGIPYWPADRACARLGLHPVEVWPGWFSIEPVAAQADAENNCGIVAVATGG